MADVWPFLLVLALAAAGAAVQGESRARRLSGFALAMSAVVAPWLLPREHPLVRSILAVAVFGVSMRATDLLRGRWTLPERVGHAISLVDSRKLTRAPPRVESLALARAVLWAALAGLGYLLVAKAAPRAAGAAFWAARWCGGLVLAYTITEAGYCLIFAGYRLAGFQTPPLHRHPALSRSVQEFWGKRWAMAVSAWLGETFFRPLARRGRPVAGLMLAFFASAVVHAYAFAPSVSPGMTALMFAYFCVQGALVALELLFGVPRWRGAAARGWTIAWMVGLSPMFTEPLLQVLGL